MRKRSRDTFDDAPALRRRAIGEIEPRDATHQLPTSMQGYYSLVRAQIEIE
jgi:hypothetical protein